MPRTVTIFVCLLITVILVFTLILPKKTALDSSQKRVEEKRVEIEGKEEYFASLKKISAELKNYQSQLLKIDSALPEDPGLALLSDFLQKSASQSGLVLTQVKLSSPARALKEEKPEFQEIKIDLTLSGSYQAFKNFLSKIEKSARLIELELLTFSAKPRAEGFKFDLKIKTHSY